MIGSMQHKEGKKEERRERWREGRKKGEWKADGEIGSLCSGAPCLEMRKEEVLILSMAFSCPSPQALAT